MYIGFNELCKKEAKSWINIFKNIIQEDKSCQFVQSEYEDRIFGVEKLSTQLMQLKNELEKDICDKFGIAKDGIYSTLMYNWLRANSCNIGSGGAWHRDSNRAQYKSIIYLSDVLDENGPFEYINERAHLKWIRVIKNGFGLRYNDNPPFLEKIVGPSGTALYADTSKLHRGSPIFEGERHALTLYFYTRNQATAQLISRFENRKNAIQN